MSFISYAQNFEDVMLWRALGHIEAGVYVDVGAQHPTVDSVSKAFHERGWHGVHIEPVRKFADLLRAERPGDTVLEVALGEHDGTLMLNVLDETGLSTAVDRHAQRHQEALGVAPTRLEVPQLTLRSALRSLAGQQVHWLKIDVEGFEEQVLKGWDTALLRPWIIVVEATEPGSPLTDYASWEPLIVKARYQFVYFDGLNRFYIAGEHPELAVAFTCPPNVFDQFTLSGQSSWELCRDVRTEGRQREAKLAALHDQQRQQLDDAYEARLRQQQRQLADLEQEATELRQQQRQLADLERVVTELRQQLRQLADLEQVADELRRLSDERAAALRAMYASASWRLSAPLRLGGRTLRFLFRRTPALPAISQGMLRSLVRRPLVWSMRQVLVNPALTSRALRFLKHRPRLKQFMHRLAVRAGLLQRDLSHAPPPTQPAPSVGTGQMSERAERLYLQLQDAIHMGKT